MAQYKVLFVSALLYIILTPELQCQEQLDFEKSQDSILSLLQESQAWYQYKNDKFTFTPLAALVLDVTQFNQDEASIRQVGDQGARYEPGQIRALRIGGFGTINTKRPWRYIFAVTYRAFDQGFNSDSADEFTLYDLRIDIPTKIGTFAFGKMKEPISMQRTASLIYLGGFERGMNLDAILPARNIGIMYYNSLYRNKVYLGLGAFKGISLQKGINWNESNSLYMGRITYNPMVGLSNGHDTHFGAGVRYSVINGEINIRQNPEAFFASSFVETGPFSAESGVTYNFELAYRFKNLVITSEITRLNINYPALENPVLNGYFVQADYILTGEQRTYRTREAVFSPAVPKKNVQNRGFGLWELTFRYSEFNTNSGLITGGNMNRLSGFITWYPTLRSKLQFGYGYVTLNRFGEIGHTQIFQWRFITLIG